HRGDRSAALIDAFGGDVGVTIDYAGNQKLPGRINDAGIGRRHDLFAHGGDLAIAHQDRSMKRAPGDGENRGVLNYSSGRRGCQSDSGGQNKNREPFHCVLSDLGPAGGSSGTGSYLAPSTKMYFT